MHIHLYVISVTHISPGTALFKPMPSMSIVGGVAGALDAITRGLAIDLAPVSVNIVCPGTVCLFTSHFMIVFTN